MWKQIENRLDHLSHRIREIETLLATVVVIGECLMTKLDEVNDAVTKLSDSFNTATNQISAEIAVLTAAAPNVNGLTEDQANAVISDLSTRFAPILTRLNQLGQNPPVVVS